MTEHPKTTTAEALLGMLSMGPMTGYEIRQRINLSIGNFWNESFGQIYPALNKLAKQGLVQAEAAGKAGRKVYSLTPAGRERLEAWLQVMSLPRVPRNEMLLKVFFGANGQPNGVRRQVQATREQYVQNLHRYTTFEPELRKMRAGHAGLPYYLMALRYGIAEAKAVIEWADETLREMERMHGTGQSLGERNEEEG